MVRMDSKRRPGLCPNWIYLESIVTMLPFISAKKILPATQKPFSGLRVFPAHSHELACEDIPSKRKKRLWRARFIGLVFIIPIFCSVLMPSINLP